jgi:TRAP-type mannitol/chloroaromatic compound transport system permease small subunit
MADLIGAFISNIAMAFVNFFTAILNPMSWLDWSNKEALIRFIYYGGSVEFFFVIFTGLIVLTIVGLWRSNILWGVVRVIEGFSNTVGRFFAWAALLMVLQQIMIVFLQRIFRVSEISMGPFGTIFTKDLSWFAEELKLYNAMIVAMCCAYTFVQGGHVRVDLFYAGAKYRTKKIVDMFGSLFFIMPTMVLTWMYGWYFMWRHLITPKVSASDKLELMLKKAKIVKWNVETIGFSPNGFNGYFIFKVLLVAFCGMMFLQAVAFFYRSLLELREGPESEGKFLDKDSLGDDTAELVESIH